MIVIGRPKQTAAACDGVPYGTRTRVFTVKG